MIELPIWVFLTGLASLVTTVVVAVWRLRGFAAEQDKLQSEHDAHEDICSHRYHEIEQQGKQLERRIDERHDALVKVSDERHNENRERLQTIESMVRQVLIRQGHADA